MCECVSPTGHLVPGTNSENEELTLAKSGTNFGNHRFIGTNFGNQRDKLRKTEGLTVANGRTKFGNQQD